MEFIAKMGAVVLMFIGIAIMLMPNLISVMVDGKKELKLVHMIYRHGIRTPADTYPKDPLINETFYPTGWGQITNEGKLELYRHGKYLRKRYGTFLGKYYSPEKYYVQVTDVDRTHVSAQCINSGLWPPEEEQQWGPLNWQPIPIHSEPLESDSLLLVRRPCSQYSLEYEKIMEMPEIQFQFSKYQKMFEEISKHSGKEIKDFNDAQDIYSTLLAQKTYNLSLPQWTENYFPDKLMEPAILSYIFNVYNTKLKRLKGGVFLKKIMEDWKNAAKGVLKPEDRKAFLYVGHDSTIVNILRTLDVWDPQMPVYAINVLLELSQDRATQEYGVEIFLRNGTSDAEPYQLQIPNCEKFCLLTQLIELAKPLIPENWEEECAYDDPDYIPPPPRAT